MRCSVGTNVRVTCRFGFYKKVSSLVLEAEDIDVISSVNLMLK